MIVSNHHFGGHFGEIIHSDDQQACHEDVYAGNKCLVLNHSHSAMAMPSAVNGHQVDYYTKAQGVQSSGQHHMSLGQSNVANPYQAAKKGYLAELEHQRQLIGVHDVDMIEPQTEVQQPYTHQSNKLLSSPLRQKHQHSGDQLNTHHDGRHMGAGPESFHNKEYL